MSTFDNAQTQMMDNAQTQVTSSGPTRVMGQAHAMGGTAFGRATANASAYTTDHNEPCNSIWLADCSSSVSKVMPDINNALNKAKEIICKNSVSAKTAQMAVVAFNSEVKVLPLADAADGAVELDQVESAPCELAFVPAESMPEVKLRAKGATHLNEAVLKALELEREQVQRQVGSGHMPHRSVLVILSDGADFPGGSVEEAAAAIEAYKKNGRIKVLFCGFGDYKVEVAERLAFDGYFEADPGANINDFLELAAHYMREFSSGGAKAASKIPTTIGTPESPVRFCSPQGKTLRQFLAS